MRADQEPQKARALRGPCFLMERLEAISALQRWLSLASTRFRVSQKSHEASSSKPVERAHMKVKMFAQAGGEPADMAPQMYRLVLSKLFAPVGYTLFKERSVEASNHKVGSPALIVSGNSVNAFHNKLTLSHQYEISPHFTLIVFHRFNFCMWWRGRGHHFYTGASRNAAFPSWRLQFG